MKINYFLHRANIKYDITTRFLTAPDPIQRIPLPLIE